jgi:uncharacterized protein YjiS (DUF1127 family)
LHKKAKHEAATGRFKELEIRDMSTLTNTVTGRDAGPASFTSALANRFAAAASAVSARIERARVYGELSRMSDRDLADIGVSRADIAQVAGYSGVWAPSSEVANS